MAAKIPAYNHHKASGRAYVQWKPFYGDKRHYLVGKFGSPESKAEYADIITRISSPPDRQSLPRPSEVQRVCELVVEFTKRKGFGKTNGKFAVRKLMQRHARTFLADFGPLALQEVRQTMIDAGWCVNHINQAITRVRYVFKWGVSQEYVSADRYGALKLVEGLRPGETSAPVHPKITPVNWADVEAVLEKLPPMVAAMVQIHGLAGLRSDEVCGLKESELDRSADVWIYRKAKHKTAHHGKEKVVCFGPRAQALMRPYLGHGGEFIFSPKIAEQERKDARAAARKTPLYGKAKTRKPSFQSTRNRYDARTYRRTLTYAFIKLANERMRKPGEPLPKRLAQPAKGENLREWLKARGVVHWFPHRLRHSRGTETRAAYGVEGAQVQLGNSLEATQIYAEKSLALAIRIASETG